MSKDDVRGILGDTKVSVLAGGKQLSAWEGQDWFITVEFDHADRVVSKHFHALSRFAVARRWLADRFGP